MANSFMDTLSQLANQTGVAAMTPGFEEGASILPMLIGAWMSNGPFPSRVGSRLGAVLQMLGGLGLAHSQERQGAATNRQLDQLLSEAQAPGTPGPGQLPDLLKQAAAEGLPGGEVIQEYRGLFPTAKGEGQRLFQQSTPQGTRYRFFGPGQDIPGTFTPYEKTQNPREGELPITRTFNQYLATRLGGTAAQGDDPLSRYLKLPEATRNQLQQEFQKQETSKPMTPYQSAILGIRQKELAAEQQAVNAMNKNPAAAGSMPFPTPSVAPDADPMSPFGWGMGGGGTTP